MLRFCLCLLTVACSLALAAGVATAADYAVPCGDLLFQQWSCIGPDHWAFVDEHDGTVSGDPVRTTSTSGVLDEYDAKMEGGTSGGSWEHMEQVVWARSLGRIGCNDLEAYYHLALVNVCGIDTIVPARQGWIRFTSNVTDGQTVEGFDLFGKRVPPTGTLFVDEIHMVYWD